MNTFQGSFQGKGRKVGIVISRFNEAITGKLLGGAMDCLTRHGVSENDINVYWVPGAWEIPMTASMLAKKGGIDGILCLGAVIRGETPHFDYVAAEVSKGVANVGINADLPVIYGILTADTVEQAMDRAGIKAGNKGFDGAMSLLEMIDLKEKI